MNTRIQQIRKTAKMTQDEFAEKIGVSKNFVWMIEKEKEFHQIELSRISVGNSKSTTNG